MKKPIFCSLLLSLFLWISGCQRDDLCGEANPTTPRLIITFNDAANPEERKDATSLKVVGEGFDNAVPGLDRVTTDSIAIPLRSLSQETSYIFILNSEDNDQGVETGNRDTLRFNYSTKEVFLSRACGVVANFEDLGESTITDADNWIQSVLILSTLVTNENETHVQILH
ncbi:DUF6452 family protein [Ascidiimonas aurantiaca]|uniref:DUF6452 family protein n=1 Tax=Ascidiimonas aurantiaca TaxID=1685432 RepID=UPI0030EC08F2